MKKKELATQSVSMEISEKGRNLYLFFGGLYTGITMPPFEFYNASKIMQEKKIFFRDLSQCWYHRGLKGVSRDIPQTALYIRAQIDQLQPRKVFFVGNSMGGYAAILFSALVGMGEAIAFAPQTFLSPSQRRFHNDTRWQSRILRMRFKAMFKKKFWDLRPVLMEKGQPEKISVFVSQEHDMDMIHAAHIDQAPHVHVHVFEGGGHGIVKKMRDEGKLPQIMSGQFDPDASDPVPGG